MGKFIFVLWAIALISVMMCVYDTSKITKHVTYAPRKYTIECLGGVSYYRWQDALAPAYRIDGDNFFMIPCEAPK